MSTPADIFFIIATICVVAVTALVSVLVFQLMQTLRDVNRIAANVEEITVLTEKVAHAVFPGMLKVAKRTGQLEERVATFLAKAVNRHDK